MATNGSDQGDGSASAPFASLQRAQQAMEATSIKVTSIEGATYYLSSPLILTEADQGETSQGGAWRYHDPERSLAAPEINGGFGSYGFAAIPDDLMVSKISVTQNIVYRNGGLSQDVFDSTQENYPSYIDPDPGTIDANLLYQDVLPATDTIFGGRQLDTSSVSADPAFANPSRGDYRMKAGSPALATGFKPAGVPLAP